MALGGGRSPSTQRPPTPVRGGPSRAPHTGRTPRWPRSASVSVLRLGLLIGGLVIIIDLLTMLITEQTGSQDEIAIWDEINLYANVILFVTLGVLVVRDTRITLTGVVAGVFASLLDAIVVTAAALMVPPRPPADALETQFAINLVIGAAAAGIGGLVYALVQRWSNGQRNRR